MSIPIAGISPGKRREPAWPMIFSVRTEAILPISVGGDHTRDTPRIPTGQCCRPVVPAVASRPTGTLTRILVASAVPVRCSILFRSPSTMRIGPIRCRPGARRPPVAGFSTQTNGNMSLSTRLVCHVPLNKPPDIITSSVSRRYARISAEKITGAGRPHWINGMMVPLKRLRLTACNGAIGIRSPTTAENIHWPGNR